MIARIFRTWSVVALALLGASLGRAQDDPTPPREPSLAQILEGIRTAEDDAGFRSWIERLAGAGRVEDEGQALQEMTRVFATESMSRRRIAAVVFESWPVSKAALEVVAVAADGTTGVYEVLYYGDVRPETLESKKVAKWAAHIAFPKDSPEAMSAFLDDLAAYQVSLARSLARYDDRRARSQMHHLMGPWFVGFPKDPAPYSQRTLSLAEIALGFDDSMLFAEVMGGAAKCHEDLFRIQRLLEVDGELPERWRKDPIANKDDLETVQKRIQAHLDALHAHLEVFAKRIGVQPPADTTPEEFTRFDREAAQRLIEKEQKPKPEGTPDKQR